MLDVKVYDNGDHTCLVWIPTDGAPIADCLGFAVKRTRTRGGREDDGYLLNRVGFDIKEGTSPEPSDKWPIQRYLWWDYDVQPEDVVKYQVIPVIGKPGALKLNSGAASPLTPALKVSGQCSDSLSAYFNRGIIASQWVARALDKAGSTGPSKQTLTQLISQPTNPLRDALGGLLKQQILQLLREVDDEQGFIYAALYELNDPELFDALKKIGSRVHLLLGNGAFKSGEIDENAEVRHRLKSETQVQVYDRIVSSPHFAHNKFVVFCDATGKPKRVLTGSTNWTETGLCTQANNGIIIADAAVAQTYQEQWQRLHAAGNGFPPSLKSADSQTKDFSVDGGKLSVWFTPTEHAEDLQQARQLINRAKDGILFLFFNPGTFQDDPNHWTLLQTILNRHKEGSNPYYAPELYIRGVVNQQIPKLTAPDPGYLKAAKDPRAPKYGHATGGTEHGVRHYEMDPAAASEPVSLYSGEAQPPQRLQKDVLIPSHIQAKFNWWDAELAGASMVMVHSKVVVIDPFGSNPVIMTGSHNLGFKASSQNDDNLVIIEGNHALAAAYAINIIAIYDQYRFRGYLRGHLQPSDGKPWSGLQADDTWQKGHLMGAGRAEIDFFLGKSVPAGAPAPARTASVSPRGSHPRVPAAQGVTPSASDAQHQKSDGNGTGAIKRLPLKPKRIKSGTGGRSR